MQRKRRKKKRFGVFLFLLVVCIGIGIMFVPWAMQPENFREVKNKINGFLYKEDFPDSYNAKSLILVDCSDDEIFVYYGNAKYIYKVNKNYEVDKNGIIDITRDIEQTTLVLTTCSKDKSKQIVIMAYLFDKENF